MGPHAAHFGPGAARRRALESPPQLLLLLLLLSASATAETDGSWMAAWGLDLDNSGGVERDEFDTFLFDKSFESFDQDGDGVCTEDEMRRGGLPQAGAAPKIVMALPQQARFCGQRQLKKCARNHAFRQKHARRAARGSEGLRGALGVTHGASPIETQRPLRRCVEQFEDRAACTGHQLPSTGSQAPSPPSPPAAFLAPRRLPRPADGRAARVRCGSSVTGPQTNKNECVASG